MEKVICGNCTFTEGYPGTSCKWCEAIYSVDSSPAVSDGSQSDDWVLRNLNDRYFLICERCIEEKTATWHHKSITWDAINGIYVYGSYLPSARWLCDDCKPK